MQHGINYIYGHRFSDNKLYTMKAYREYKFLSDNWLMHVFHK